MATLNNVVSTITADAADMKDTVKSKLQRWLRERQSCSLLTLISAMSAGLCHQ